MNCFPGRNRSNSIKYGFVIPLCRQCHRDITNNYEYINFWKVKAQTYFEKNIGTKEEFIKIFGMDYIYLYKKKSRVNSLLDYAFIRFCVFILSLSLLSSSITSCTNSSIKSSSILART